MPPGWSHFVGTVRSGDWTKFTVVTGSSGVSPRTGRVRDMSGHLGRYEFEEALRFLDSVGNEPFFLVVATQAPHEPATPEPRDRTLYAGYEYRDRAWGERNVSDKPRYVRRRARRFRKNLMAADELHRDQLRTLRTVDRGVEAIHEHLTRTGKLRKTVVVFTSDNGYQWGEHRLEGKNLPYEESIRVPLLVSLAGAATGDRDQLVATNLDLGATVLDLAGIHTTDRALARNSDGLSLRSLLRGKDPSDANWRSDLLVQSFTRGFAALLTREPLGDVERPRKAGWTWKYIEHEGGSPQEAYRSDADRFETESLDKDALFRAEYRPALSERLHQIMGLYLVTDNLPTAALGEEYRKTFAAVGATPPYRWTVVDGKVPRGLRLHRRRGTLAGTPKEAGDFTFSVRVEASSNARYLGTPQTFTRKLRLKVR